MAQVPLVAGCSETQDEVVAVGFAHQQRRGCRLTDREGREDMLEVFHAFDFEIGVFAEVELAVEKHHGAVERPRR